MISTKLNWINVFSKGVGVVIRITDYIEDLLTASIEGESVARLFLLVSVSCQKFAASFTPLGAFMIGEENSHIRKRIIFS